MIQLSAMPETVENARRWSGLVCPDCRFVFRVPRDHDGRGVVCPSCRRLLRIPATGDLPPPLVVPLPGPEPAAGQPGDEPRSGHRKRRRRSGHSTKPSWDRAHENHRRSRRSEKRQMLWMLVGGVALFGLIVGGVLVAMRGGPVAGPTEPPTATAADPSAAAAQPEPVTAHARRSEAEFLRLAEPLARTFLDARRVDDLLAVVRNPELAAPRMNRHYPDGLIDPPGMAEFNIDAQVTWHDSIASLRVRTRDFEERTLSFCETPAGPRIDWESWVGWSDLSWEDFLDHKPKSPKSFRLLLSDVDYYNMAFSDEAKWRSYRLESPDGERFVYGYVERGSLLDSRLRPPPDLKQIPLILALHFPAEGTSRNQVVISALVTEGWVLENESPP